MLTGNCVVYPNGSRESEAPPFSENIHGEHAAADNNQHHADCSEQQMHVRQPEAQQRHAVKDKEIQDHCQNQPHQNSTIRNKDSFSPRNMLDNATSTDVQISSKISCGIFSRDSCRTGSRSS